MWIVEKIIIIVEGLVILQDTVEIGEQLNRGDRIPIRIMIGI